MKMKKEKVKTLKCLNEHDGSKYFECEAGNQGVFLESKLKSQVIKWIKEDLNYSEICSDPIRLTIKTFCMKWMKRLDITPEDLEK